MLKITASLLNSWNYIWESEEEWQEKSYQDFLNTLHRVKTETTPAMQRGIEFEAMCVAGEVPPISNIIRGGQFQVYAEKVYEIDGQQFKLLGYIDVIKAGKIYDIKRNTKYEYGKYESSYQHWCYLALIENAYEFTYLIGAGYSNQPYDDKVEIHEETYFNDGQADLRVIKAIQQFVSWLKAQGLYDVYVNNFTIENKK